MKTPSTCRHRSPPRQQGPLPPPNRSPPRHQGPHLPELRRLSLFLYTPDRAGPLPARPNVTNLVPLLSGVTAAWAKRNYVRGNAFEQSW